MLVSMVLRSLTSSTFQWDKNPCGCCPPLAIPQQKASFPTLRCTSQPMKKLDAPDTKHGILKRWPHAKALLDQSIIVHIIHLSNKYLPPPKINMSPEKGPFRKESIVFQAAFFRGQALSFRGQKYSYRIIFYGWSTNPTLTYPPQK